MLGFQGNLILHGKFNNYLIGGNITNAFAVGEVGSNEDFFLIGAEPEGESNYPLLTGNFFDSEGNLLFRLVQNMLVVNPGHCSKIESNLIGYEIHDSAEKLIFRISTKFQEITGGMSAEDEWRVRTGNLSPDAIVPKFDKPEEYWVTTIEGNFFGKNGQHILSANNDSGLAINETTKFAIGVHESGFGIVNRMDKEEQVLAFQILQSRGLLT
jgi:hypothetical protein